MHGPPDNAHSLEGSYQLGNGPGCYDGGTGTRFFGEIRAGSRDVADVTGGDFDLCVLDVAGEIGDPCQGQDTAKKRMSGIRNGDPTFAFFRDEWSITVVELCRCHCRRSGSS
jgi:hypothetical protein